MDSPKDYIVTDAEIMNILWPDGSGNLKRVQSDIMLANLFDD